MNDYYFTMIKLLRQNRVDNIMALLDQLHVCEPERIKRIELYYLTKFTAPYDVDGAALTSSVQEMMGTLTGTALDDARLSIPPELSRYFKSRALLYAFVCAYFPDLDLYIYYDASSKGLDFMRELVYLVVLRLDKTVRMRLAGIADEQLRALGREFEALPPSESTAADAAPKIAERWPEHVVDDVPEEPRVVNDDAPSLRSADTSQHSRGASSSRVQEEESVGARRRRRALRPRKPREETAQLIIQNARAPEEGEGGPSGSPQSEQRGVPLEDQVWMQARWALARRTPTLLPDMVLTGEYSTAVADVLPRAALAISHILERPNLLYYKVAEMYNILTIWNQHINPARGEGVYLYLRFFTLTHLRLVLANVEADVRELVKYE
jgi:hypothetical protein